MTPTQKRRARRKASQKGATAAITTAANGIPRHRGGNPPRTAEPTTAAMDARQTRHFDLHLQGMSHRQIQQVTGHDRTTIALDIRFEGERRALEFVAERSQNIATSVGRLEAVISRALARGQLLRETGTEQVDDPARPGQKITKVKSVKAIAAANLADRLVIQAQKQIDAVLGVSSSLPANATGAAGTGSIVGNNVMVVMLEHMNPEERRAYLERLRLQAQALGALPVAR